MKGSSVKVWDVVLTLLVGVGISLGSLPTGQAAEKPKPGGTLVVGLHADPDTLNPIVSSEMPARMVAANVFSRLLYVDTQGNHVGDLAEKWTISQDNLKIRFELRKGAKFHDGRPVTAEDVKFSLGKLAKYNPRSVELKRISEITVLGEYSIEIRFPTPSPTFFSFLDDAGFVIPKHIYASTEDLTLHPANSNPVGSGPFTFQEWRKGDRVVLNKNKNYYVPGEPFVDKTFFRIIPSGASRVLSLETGDLDYIGERALPETDVPRLRKNPNFVVTDRGMGSSSLNFLLFNTRRKPWDDVRVRRAVAHAVDRKVLAERGTFGLGQPAYSPFSKGSWPWAYNPKVEEMYPLDPAKAAKLLDEAGYPMGPGGVRFKTTVITDRGDSRTADITEIIQQQLKKVGIDMVIQALDKPTMAQRVWIAADFDLWSGPSSQGSDPAIGIERIFTTEGIPPVPSVHNGNEYRNPEVDKLFRLARTTMDQKKRGQYYRDTQPIILNDLPTLPLVDTPKFAAFHKKVQGVNDRRFWSIYYAPSDAWFSQ
ncbi:MAG: ABC transporter substrate-binding protein [Deltaproteobacteria bacterium]